MERQRRDLGAAGVDEALSYLPPETWHVTISDVVTQPADELVGRITRRLEGAFRTLSEHERPAPQLDVRSDAVACAGISLVAAVDPVDEHSLATLRWMRALLCRDLEGLGLSMPDPLKFVGHMTLAYFVGPLDAARMRSSRG